MNIIVGSNEILAEIWRRHLARQGINAIVSTSQSHAVSWLSENRPDVVVIDLMLSRGSAFLEHPLFNSFHGRAS